MYMILLRVCINCSQESVLREMKRSGGLNKGDLKWEFLQCGTPVYLVYFWRKRFAWAQLEQDCCILSAFWLL
jgi:hypothetical protein